MYEAKKKSNVIHYKWILDRLSLSSKYQLFLEFWFFIGVELDYIDSKWDYVSDALYTKHFDGF